MTQTPNGMMAAPAASPMTSFLAHLRPDWLLPWLVLAISLLATHQLWQVAQWHLRDELRNEFEFGIREAELQIGQRVANCRNTLTGLQALYLASGQVGRAEFTAYVSGLHLEENQPGIQSLGYAPLVPAGQLPQHLAEIRKQGFHDYAIRPDGEREFYAPVIHIEPFQGRNLRVFGLDNYATPERRATLERARDSEDASISGKLTLVQDDDASQPGILMFLPVYRNGIRHDTPDTRRTNLTGWVSAAFRMDDLMANLLNGHSTYFHIEIYDGTAIAADALLYNSSHNAAKPDAAFRDVRQIQVADRLWTLQVTSKPAFDAKLTDLKPKLIAAIGVGCSLTLALCTWLLLRSRTRALADAQRLDHARRQAERANQAKNEFLANISHELRTPMNAILGMTHLILRNESEPRRREQLEKIQFSGEHLLNIINGMLDLSSMEGGELRLHPVDFTLHELQADIEQLVSAEIASKGLQLAFEVEPGLHHRKLHGDVQRLEQVMLSYLDNAIKFTEQGRITLRISLQEEDATSCGVRFEVQDTGIGIAEEKRAHLFDPFWQVDTSSTRRHEGIGLGLSICKKLAEIMPGGSLGVDSSPGDGSTFWFHVRLDKASTAQPAGNQAENEQNAAQLTPDMFARIKGARILVAEDHTLSQTIIGELLESAGAKVIPAWNGAEAIELLRQKPCDCVLMDVQMPEMDGVEATRVIRSDPALARLPVIGITAHASAENRRRCLDAGMNDFIGKPFSPNAFYAMLSRWLPPRTGSDAADSSQPADTAKPELAVDPEVIDLSVLAELIGPDPLKLREFVQRFLTLARGDMAHIESALERDDLDTLSRLAHHNKAPARMVGARGFARLCEELMEHCKQGAAPEQIRETVMQMRPLLDRIEQTILQDLT